MEIFVWDHIDRIPWDQCKCNLCKRIQKVTKERSPREKLRREYAEAERDTVVLTREEITSLV